jgi:hypothetical protein
MQAATCETISGERRASSLLPMDTLAATIKARIAKGDKATSDADGPYLAAGLLLLEAKRRLPLEQPGMRWTAYLVGTCKIGTTRADELIAIAEERTTVEAQREKNRNRQRDFAARNKAARSNVSNVSPTPDPLSEQRTIVTRAMLDLDLPKMFLLAKYAVWLKSGRDVIKEKANKSLAAAASITPRKPTPAQLRARRKRMADRKIDRDYSKQFGFFEGWRDPARYKLMAASLASGVDQLGAIGLAGPR